MSIKRSVAMLLCALLLAGQLVPAAAGQLMTPTHTIAEARQLPNGTTGVTIQGTISAPLDIYNWNEMWGQDATAGIDIYGVAPAGLQVGDLIEVTGTIDEYNGKKEIIPGNVSDVVLIDRGVPPAPLMTTTGSISETSEGWLVAVTGTITDVGPYGFDIDDGSGSTAVYIDGDTGIGVGNYSDGDLITLVGISSQYDSSPPPTSGYQITPRFQVDLAPGAVEPIALARLHSAGMTVTVQGAVTCLPGTFETPAQNREIYIQDGTAGIDVFAYSGLPIPTGTLALGDIVTITGSLDVYHNKLELIPTAIVTQGITFTVVPKIQLAGNILEPTEGLLMIVTGTLSNITPVGAHVKFDLTDASGTGVVFIDADTGIDLADYSEGDTVRVIGLGGEYDGEYQLTPRMQSDLAHASGDFDPPGITMTVPVSDAIGVNPYFAIQAVFDEPVAENTIDDTTFLLEDGSGPVAGLVYYDNDRLTAVFEPAAALAADAVYTATVTGAVEDTSGNPMGADYVWRFTTGEAAMTAYLGSLHNHTIYSDGAGGDPNDAYTAARDRGLDFFAVTDHSYAVNDTEWEDTMTQAISHTEDGVFVALAGWEYTHSYEGHINGYGTLRRPVRDDYGYSYTDYCETLADFYNWVADHPEVEGHFNHPAWMNFNDWAYYPETEQQMQMIEVGNGAYSYYVWTEKEYIKGLDYGWRFGPTNNGDTHTDQWGLDNPGRTGLWATALTEAGLMEAMNAMRVFATEDGNQVLSLKGDGAWMGQTIPNDGAIDFEVYVDDADGEGLDTLALVADTGVVIDELTNVTVPYTWTLSLTITEGVHYYYVRTEQADGDLALSAPIWTEGNVDVAPTRLDIVPAQLTTQMPAEFTVRVTNRGAAEAAGVNVNLWVDATVVGSDVVTVPVNADAFATIEWMPDITGVVVIAAEITNVPTGDNPDDNVYAEEREIIDEMVPLIVLDNGHDNNIFVSGSAEDFKDDLVAYNFNWIEDTDGITTADLESAVLLFISDPGTRGQDLYSESEEQVIADYVNNGGALLIAGDSDYHDHGNPDEINAILAKIDGSRIRMNSDGTYDDTNQGWVGPWHVLWHVFPNTLTTGIAVNTDILVGFSGASIYGVDDVGTPIPLTTGNGVTLTVVGDDDTYQNDGDGLGDHFVYPTGTVIPMAAVQALPGGGRLAVWGDSNESFSDAYTYVQADGFQNEIYNMETIYWLLGHPMQQRTIAEARADAEWDNKPDHLNELVWVEGTLTAGRDYFYETYYLQDDSGGIAIYTVDPEYLLTDTLTTGWQVRVVGRLETYNDETDVLIAWEPLQAWPLVTGTVPTPTVFGTADAALEENEGWLIQTAGLVVQVIDAQNIVIDDGSGPARVFIDMYNGSFAGVLLGDWAEVIGLASEDADGQRIRLRQLDDLVVTPGNRIYLPVVFKGYAP